MTQRVRAPPSLRLHRFDRRGWTFLRHHHPSVRNWSESKIHIYGIHWYPLHGPSSAHGRHGLPWIPMAVAQILAWMYEAHHEPFRSSTGDRCAAPVFLG